MRAHHAGTRAEMRTNLAKRLVPYHIIEGLGDEPIRKKGTVPDICVTQDRTHGPCSRRLRTVPG